MERNGNSDDEDEIYKNTLDSDEEDDEMEAERKNRLEPDLLEECDEEQEDQGEATTIPGDGDIKVTPFNMNEELKEGHFDKNKNFIFDKKIKSRRGKVGGGGDDDESEEDAWADNVEHMTIYKPVSNKNDDHKAESNRSEKRNETGVKRKQRDEDEEDAPPTDPVRQYEKMASLMLPDETVQKTIQRLGKNVPRGRQFRQKKTSSNGDVDTKKLNDDKAKLDKFIGLAHNIMETVDLEIYQKTYEHIQMQVKKARGRWDNPSTSAAQALERDLDSSGDEG